MSFTSTTTRLISRRVITNSLSRPSRCLLSTHCQEAVERLKGALEEYRVHNYQRAMPTRFKKEMIKGCSLTGPTSTSKTTTTQTNIAVEELEQLLRNIGAFGDRVTHDDVEIIVSEHCSSTNNTNASTSASSEEIHADKILMKIL